MLDAFSEHFEREGSNERLHIERFQPRLGLGEGDEGEGGDDQVPALTTQAESDGSVPILVAGEEAGLDCPTAAERGSATPASACFAPAACVTFAPARSAGRRGR